MAQLTEVPAYFRAGGETLFGILTEATGQITLGSVVVQLRGGNQGPSSGRNQASARLSRRLAEAGFHAFRFDYRGVGESTGEVERFRLDEPFVEDALAALNHLRSLGMQRFILLGSCFGARTALAAAKEVSGLESIVLLSTPVRDKIKSEEGVRPIERHPWRQAARSLAPEILLNALRVRRRRALERARSGDPADDRSGGISSSFLADLESVLLGRRVPLLLLSGTGDPGFQDLDGAMAGRLGDILRSGGDLADVRILQGRVGAFADVRLQQPVIDLVVTWLEEQSADPPGPLPGTTDSAVTGPIR